MTKEEFEKAHPNIFDKMFKTEKQFVKAWEYVMDWARVNAPSTVNTGPGKRYGYSWRYRNGYTNNPLE